MFTRLRTAVAPGPKRIAAGEADRTVMERETILQRWGITAAELTEIVAANPSMRGLMVGYVAEYKLRKMFFESDTRVENLTKYDDHDRGEAGGPGVYVQTRSDKGRGEITSDGDYQEDGRRLRRQVSVRC